MNKRQEQKLGKLLIEEGFIDEKDLEKAHKLAKKRKESLHKVLVDSELISAKHIGKLYAEIMGWRSINLASEPIDQVLVRSIPIKVALKQKILAFHKDAGGIKLAMNNPDDTTLIHLLEKKFGQKIHPYFASETDIAEQYKLYNSDIEQEFKLITKNKKFGDLPANAITDIVDMLLQRGYADNASDIHVEPYDDNTLVRFRIDGVLEDVLIIPKEYHSSLISRVKVMAHLRTDEHQIPQDGKLQVKIGGFMADVRVSIVPTTKGENIVMRLLSEKSKQFTMTQLGLSMEDLEKLKKVINKSWGMILTTGPTGSGKTTSLYAMLKMLNSKDINIATIEDPVEYNIDGITQIQVHEKANLTFAAGLRSLVRQDPDIVMVGEIRDPETASIAVNSALTGHLVLSTLHTNDAPTTLPRLLEMDVEPFLIASTVNVVIAQRLVRKICNRCIESYELKASELRKKVPEYIVEKIMKKKKSIRTYRGKGCGLCVTGFMGRIGVYEILEVDDDLRKLILENADADTLREKAIEKGMKTMFDDTLMKAQQGVTTVGELLRVVKV